MSRRSLSPATSLALMLTVAFAGLLGAAAAARPTASVGLLLGLIAAAAIMLLPLRLMPAFVALGLACVPSVILEAKAHHLLALTPLSGQARLLTCLFFVSILRLAIERPRLTVSGSAAAAAVIYVGWTLFTVIIAIFRGNGYAGMASDLSRQLTYPLAAVIGVVAAGAAREAGRRVAIFRGLAAVSIVASCLSVLYWSWVNLQLPLSNPVFRAVLSVTAFDPRRSVFPFAEDSPNLLAIAVVALAAFPVPFLISGGRRDRRLAVLTACGGLVAVMTTESRSGILALVAATVAFLVLSGAFRRVGVLTVVVALAVAGVALYSLLPSERQLSTHASTLVAREGIWHQAVGKFAASIVVGQGYRYSAEGNFQEVIPSGIYSPATARPQSVHGDFLGAAVDGGLIGVSAFVSFLVLIGISGRRLLRSPTSRAIGVGLICVLASDVVSMAGDSVMPSAVNATLLWLFLGIAAGSEPSAAENAADTSDPNFPSARVEPDVIYAKQRILRGLPY